MRRFGRLSAVVFCLGILASMIPPASAQVPEPALFKVQVEGPEEKLVIRQSLGSATLEFTISVLCKTSTDQYDPCAQNQQLRGQDVDITVEQPRSPYPGGWKVELQSDPAFTIKAGDIKKVPVKASLQTDDPDRDQIRVELRANARPRSGTPLPLPGQVEGSQTSSASDSQNVEKVLTFAENIESLTRTYWVPLLSGAFILGLGAVVLARGSRRRGGLALVSEAPSQTVLPGRGASFPVRLENHTRDDDRVRLRASHLPSGWVSILPLDEVDLRGGEQTQLWVTLRAPPRAVPGQTMSFELRAVSSKEPSRDARTPLTVTVGLAPTVPGTAPDESPGPSESLVVDVEEEAPAASEAGPGSEPPPPAEGSSRRRRRPP